MIHFPTNRYQDPEAKEKVFQASLASVLDIPPTRSPSHSSFEVDCKSSSKLPDDEATTQAV